jgi:thymidine phosphorylase
MCIAQGVRPSVFNSESSLLSAIGLLDSNLLTTVFVVSNDGWVSDIDAMALGQVVLQLGGGRQSLGDEIDSGVGFVLDAHIGSKIEENEEWITIYHRKPLSDEHRLIIEQSLVLSDESVEMDSRIIDIL